MELVQRTLVSCLSRWLVPLGSHIAQSRGMLTRKIIKMALTQRWSKLSPVHTEEQFDWPIEVEFNRASREVSSARLYSASMVQQQIMA
jgi:hypothetical protein